MLTETQGWTLLTALTGTDLAAMGREMAEAEAKLKAVGSDREREHSAICRMEIQVDGVVASYRGILTRLVAAVKALAREDGQ